jgi:hypothetical protein
MFLPVDFSYWVFALILVLNGFGSGLFASPNRAEIMNSVPANQRGAAGGTIATFQNASFVLSIGIFFSLIVIGLSSSLPASLSGGLISNGVPAATANAIGHLPPIGVLFAAFLGYNPIKQLLGSGLGHLSAAHASYLTGRDFFPTVITQPFKDGLTIAFWFAIAASVIAALASLLTSQRKGRTAQADAEPVGEELAGVAAAGDWEPAELVIPAVDVSDPASGAARLAAIQQAGAAPGTGTGVTGAVQDLSGRPVAGANITVTSAEGRQLTRAVSSPAGRYTLAGLPGGAITVIVTSPGHEPTAVALLTQPGSVLQRDFTLTGSGMLSGFVRSAAQGGVPLAGASVVISDPQGRVVASAVTSGDGAFSVQGAPSGTYALTATASGHLPASQQVQLNGHTETAQLTLPLEREVNGFVRAPGGAPMPGISVTAATASGEIVATGVTDADGWYRLTGLGDGEHVLVAGGHEPVSATVEVTSGETTSVTVRIGGVTAPESPAAPADGNGNGNGVTSQLGTGHGE